MLGWALVIPQQSIQAHDYARCAEAALATVALSDTLLGGMRLLDVADAFDRDDMFAVNAGKRGKTGIDACMVDLFGGWIVLGDNDGAGSTSTLAAATVQVNVSLCVRDGVCINIR